MERHYILPVCNIQGNNPILTWHASIFVSICGILLFKIDFKYTKRRGILMRMGKVAKKYVSAIIFTSLR